MYLYSIYSTCVLYRSVCPWMVLSYTILEELVSPLTPRKYTVLNGIVVFDLHDLILRYVFQEHNTGVKRDLPACSWLPVGNETKHSTASLQTGSKLLPYSVILFLSNLIFWHCPEGEGSKLLWNIDNKLRVNIVLYATILIFKDIYVHVHWWKWTVLCCYLCPKTCVN
jgi:hypothetical protein